eukprot:6994844-Prymnesium_polylepis.1
MVHRYTRTPLYSTTCELPKIPVELTGFPSAHYEARFRIKLLELQPSCFERLGRTAATRVQ